MMFQHDMVVEYLDQILIVFQHDTAVEYFIVTLNIHILGW